MVDSQVTSCSNVLCLSQPGGGSACLSLATDRALPAGADVFFAGAAGKNGTGSGPKRWVFIQRNWDLSQQEMELHPKLIKVVFFTIKHMGFSSPTTVQNEVHLLNSCELSNNKCWIILSYQ